MVAQIFSRQAVVTVSASTISGNVANGDGGGIQNDFASLLTFENGTISGNFATSGGGINNWYADATIVRSTISGNSASLLGGGIRNYPGGLTVTSCTVSGNSAIRGGGIWSKGTFEIANSTISGNLATLRGGGIENYGGLTAVLHSTISNNTADPANGSGIASRGHINTQTTVFSTIVAGNLNTDVDVVPGFNNSFQSNGYNLIGSGNAAVEFVEAGDQTGVINAMLSPLAYHGEVTQTHALLPNSPAIDAGDPVAEAGAGGVPDSDQHGTGYAPVFNPFGMGIDRIDIGAFEWQEYNGTTAIVDTLADESDGNFSAGDLSLREAIELANWLPTINTMSLRPRTHQRRACHDQFVELVRIDR